LKDPDIILKSARLFLNANPDQVNRIGQLVLRNADALWDPFAKYMGHFPILQSHLRRFIRFILESSPKKAATLIRSLDLTEYSARTCIEELRCRGQREKKLFFDMGKWGDLAFRQVAAYCSREIRLWGKFCRHFRGHSVYIEGFLKCVDDYVKAGNVRFAVGLLYELAVKFAVGSPADLATVQDFLLEMISLIRSEADLLRGYMKVFCFVHPWAHVIRPVIGDMLDDLEPWVVDLVLRYLHAAVNDASGDFLVFRLRLLRRRMALGQTPKFWTDEMLQLK
jgi:hypothetical protein